MYLKSELYELISSSEDIFDLVQKYALDGLWFWDLEKPEELWMNQKLLSVLGFASPDTSHHTSWIHILNREVLQEILNALPSRQKYPDFLYSRNIKYSHKNGNTLSFLFKARVVKQNKSGDPSRILGLHTLQKEVEKEEQELIKAKEKAEKSEERYRTLFENMNTGFVLFKVVQDEQGTPVDLLILAANKSFEDTTGLNLKDAVGSRLTFVLPGIEKDEADWIGTYSKVALTGESIRFEQGSELLGYYYSVTAFPAGPKECAVTFLDITDRKQAEVKLRDSEYRFRKIYEDGANGMVMVSEDSRFLKANPTFCRMTGYKEKELRKMTFSDITHEEDRAKDVSNHKKMLAGEIEVYRREKRYIHKNGEIFWVQLTTSPIYDTNGNFLYFFGIVVNITERITAERNLRESEERFRLATEHAKVAVWEYDFTTNYMSRSRNHDKLYGLKWQTIWNLDAFLKATHPDDREASNQNIINSIIPGGPDNKAFEFRVVHPDDSIHWLLVSSQVIERDQSGRGIKIRGTLADITERKRTELDLLQMSKLLKSSQEIAHLGSFQFVAANKTTVWSEEEFRIYGLDPNDESPSYKEMLKNFIHPEDRALLESSFNKAIKSLGIYELEHRIIRPSGEVRWILDKAHPHFNEYGIYTGYIGATLDITERKELLEQLEKLNTELELKVKERTSLLEASNKELEAFSYSVSHDLRAPLRHINGYVDLLIQRYSKDLPEKALHYLNTVSAASGQMGTLIDDLLQYSRTGRMEVKKTEVDQNSLLKEVRETFEQMENDRNINWEICDLPRVNADPALLKLVWTNLIDNAVKYTRNQEIAKIIVACRDEKESFVFSVSDNGVGFEMRYAQKLFGVFQRLHSQAEFEGTGIGLANVQRIIHKHSGRVWAEAKLGEGAQFYFTLPKDL